MLCTACPKLENYHCYRGRFQCGRSFLEHGHIMLSGGTLVVFMGLISWEGTEVQGGLGLHPFHQGADRRPSTHKHPLWAMDGLILSTGQAASILDVVYDRNGDSGNFSLIIRLPQGSHSDLN